MIIVTLLNNMVLLVALSYVQSLVLRRWSPKSAAYRISSGLLFGGVAIAGMMTPFDFGSGVIFDGRSIVISVAGLFGGAVPVVIAAAMAAAYRIWLGGGGVLMGLLVISESALVGLAFRWLRRRYPERAVEPHWLLSFGLVVHTIMLLLVSQLPNEMVVPVLQQIWVSVITLYPLATLVICWIFLDQEARITADQALRASEERFRGLVESSADHIFMLDRTGRIAASNARATQVGMPALDELVGRTLEEIHVPEVAALYRAYFDQVLQTGEPVRFEHHTGREDDRIHSDVLFPIRVDGDVVGIGGICHDITERIHAQEALRVALAKYTVLFESFPLAILVVDPEGQVLETNALAERLLGITPGKLERPRWPMVRPDGSPLPNEELPCMRALAEKRLISDLELGIVAPDSTVAWLTATAMPLALEGYGAVVAFMDVTARKQSEQERLELERQLLHTQKLESLGVLAGGVAHDFNNLLAAILGNLDLALLDLDVASPVRPRVGDAIQATRRATDLTRQMLAYSGKGRFVVSELDLSALVEENAHILRTAIARTATLTLDLAEALPPILADVGQIQQVVMNLITNASEALQDQPGIVAVSTGVVDCDTDLLADSLIAEKAEPGLYVWLEVRDSGCGMDRVTQQRIFEPFFTTKAAGRGLGMAAILGIVRGHKGAIMIDSALGQGTRVRAYFPAVPGVATPRRAQGRHAEIAPPAAADTPVAGSDARGSILVVDDEEMILGLASRLVGRLGYQALTAADGEEAVQVFRAHGDEIVCVLLDLTIPKLDGIGTFDALRRMRADVPVILSSGYNEQAATQRLVGQQLSGFLQKPYRLQELRAALEKVLGRSI